MFGTSSLLINLNEVRPASSERLKAYYEGGRLWWDIIAAYGDVVRDRYETIFKRFSLFPDGIKIVCLTGEPGSGKSTVAWRLAADIANATNLPLIQVRNSKDDNFWYSLDISLQQYGRPIIILVDDIFRSPDVVHALSSISPHLKALIISTSRSHEMPPDISLPYEIEVVDLKTPTGGEKNKVLEKLNINKDGMKPSQLDRLIRANSWLVLMYELTTGEELTNRIRENVRNLQTQDFVLYKLYEYVCFAGQYDLEIPLSLVELLDKDGMFFHVVSRPASRGLLFQNSPNYLSSQHSIISKIVLGVYSRDPFSVMNEIGISVNPSEPTHRDFFYKLLDSLLMDGKADLVKLILTQNRIEIILDNCYPFELINQWSKIFAKTNNKAMIARIADMALLKPFEQFNDWLTIKNIIEKKKGDSQKFITKTLEWLLTHPKVSDIRVGYMVFVEKIGDAEQVKQLIDDMAEWLQANEKDSYVRTYYLGLVERKGDDKQVKQLIDDTAEWLKLNELNNDVRTAYLGLVERKGDDKQVKQLIDDTAVWLLENRGDTAVRENYLGLMERKGDGKQVEQLIDDTAVWLLENRGDTAVRQRYIRFLTVFGNVIQIRKAIEEIPGLLKIHNGVNSIVFGLLKLLTRHGDKKELADFYSSSSKLVINSEAFKSGTVVEAYAGLLMRLEHYEDAEIYFRKSLTIYKRWVAARIGLAWSLYYQGNKKQAYSELKHVRWWAEKPQVYPVAGVYFHFGRYWFLEGNYKTASDYFKKAIKASPDSYGNYWELGRTLLAKHDFDNALKTLLLARERVPKNLKEDSIKELDLLLLQAREKKITHPELLK